MALSNIKNLKRVLVGGLLSLGFCGATWAQAALPSAKTTVIYFGQNKAEDFELKVKPVFADFVKSCKRCEILNYTPYTKTGEVDMESLQERLESLPEGASFVFFDFNMKVNDANKELVDLLNKKADSGLVIVGAAGGPRASEASSPLSRTILGQVHGALIIGELGERDRLFPVIGFYGPEMLTALRAPRDLVGQGYSPLIFTANLATNWQKRSSSEWVEHFRMKKMKTRKLWLDLGDLF
nr:hypothetical protein BdHM001_20700 [Bdellovibrio sp. HM001]BFD67275.1 hypothetical protein HAGR004_22970 [Bdellovibrio sp. HAGR004]